MIAFLACLLCTFAHIPSIILRYVPFSSKITRKQKIVLYSIYLLAVLLNLALCFYLELNGKLSIAFFKTNLTLFCMIMALANIIVIKGFLKEHLFAFGLTVIIVLILYSISAFIADKFTPNDVNLQLVMCNLLLLVLFIATYYPAFKLMKKMITPFLEIKDKSYWNTIWFIPVSMFFASVLAMPINSHISTFTQLVGRMLIGIATLFMCFSVSKDYKRILERERMSRQIELQKQYYSALTEKVNSERELRHNFKHHIAAIRGFIDADDKQGLSLYFDKFEEYQSQNIQIPYTGNVAVDGVLYHYAVISSAEDIRFETNGSLQNCTLPDIELCNLLGNALDNAFTACKAFNGKRYINVAMEQNGKMLSIVIDNSFDGILKMQNDKILSKKRDNEEGIGIACMKKICFDHNGTCKFTPENNKFEASFLLQI